MLWRDASMEGRQLTGLSELLISSVISHKAISVLSTSQPQEFVFTNPVFKVKKKLNKTVRNVKIRAASGTQMSTGSECYL